MKKLLFGICFHAKTAGFAATWFPSQGDAFARESWNSNHRRTWKFFSLFPEYANLFFTWGCIDCLQKINSLLNLGITTITWKIFLFSIVFPFHCKYNQERHLSYYFKPCANRKGNFRLLAGILINNGKILCLFAHRYEISDSLDFHCNRKKSKLKYEKG